MYRIYFDVNDEVDRNCYQLACFGSLADIAPIADKLHDGLHVIIYMGDEVEMEAVLEFDATQDAWTALALLETIKYHSGPLRD